GNISTLKGKWIKIVPEDFAQYGLGLNYQSPDSMQKEFDKKKELVAEQMKLLLELADKHHAIEISGNPVKESVNGVSAYRYDLTLNRKNIAAFYKDAATTFTEKYKNESPITLDPETLDFLNSASADAVFDYINKNTTFSVWADSNGIPVKFQVAMRVVPNGRRAATNQININVALNLIGVNKSVTIDTPKDAMTVEDAYMLMSGKTKDQITYEKQVQTISQIRYALQDYKSYTGAYPTSLNDLTKKRSEIKKSGTTNNDDYFSSTYNEQPLLQVVPTDAFTKQPFGYSSDGKTFSLTYTMNLPPYQKGTSLYGMYNSLQIPDFRTGVVSNLSLEYVNGTNTADPEYDSQEALAAAKKDSDGDKVSDIFEDYIGSNKNKKDTDGDSYSDYKEITGGTNPLGPGNLERTNDYYY
ncbi:MAG: hypothetical protein K0S38_1075, partial [Candidatus Paceibacter sp.]|nr:hypothetical protein [Candidatus Paceibacter sp.]